jgi:hypothetical protein
MNGLAPSRRAAAAAVASQAHEALLKATIGETGQVACSLRMFAGIARDRCCALQRETGCTCTAGDVARKVRRTVTAWEAKEADRLERAREAYDRNRNGKRREPWKLVCGWKGCRKPFTAARGFHRKPVYCSEECERAATRAHTRERQRARRALEKAGAR